MCDVCLKPGGTHRIMVDNVGHAICSECAARALAQQELLKNRKTEAKRFKAQQATRDASQRKDRKQLAKNGQVGER